MLVCVVSGIGHAGRAERPYGQEDASAEVPEKLRRQYRWLFEAEFAKVELARVLPELNDAPRKLTAPFRAGAKIDFRLLTTNISKENKSVLVGNTFKHNRPQLYKDRELLPYREKVRELVSAGDTPHYEDPRFRPLKSGATLVEVIDLNEWYEALQPGSYKLVVRHRFVWGGRWLESQPMTFEVVP
jgi:hypothetical protein